MNQHIGFLWRLSSIYLYTFLADYLGKDPIPTAQDGLHFIQCRSYSLGWKPASPPLVINLSYYPVSPTADQRKGVSAPVSLGSQSADSQSCFNFVASGRLKYFLILFSGRSNFSSYLLLCWFYCLFSLK